MDNPLHTAQNNAPVVAFVTGSLLLGSLINTFPPGDPDHISSAQVCPQRNNTTAVETGLLPKPAIAALTLLFPLLAMSDRPSRKLFVSHIVGQTGSFSTSELARYLIVKPNAQFFQDCQLSPQTCLTTAILQPLVDKGGICTNTTSSDYEALRDNLHGFPDVTSSLVGASVACFFLALAAKRRRTAPTPIIKNVEKEDDEHENKITQLYFTVKPHLKLLFVVATLSILCVLVVDRYIQSVNTLFEMFFSIIFGASLQLAAHYFITSK
jgi:hypothetical protein